MNAEPMFAITTITSTEPMRVRTMPMTEVTRSALIGGAVLIELLPRKPGRHLQGRAVRRSDGTGR